LPAWAERLRWPRLANLTDYIFVPLKKALHDANAYVRKTAVMGCIKVYHLSPKVVMSRMPSSLLPGPCLTRLPRLLVPHRERYRGPPVRDAEGPRRDGDRCAPLSLSFDFVQP
jgi:hypothetical protein